MAVNPPASPGPGNPWLELDRTEGLAIEQLRAATGVPLTDPAAWIDEEVERGVLLTSLDALLGWGRRYSTWPAAFGLAC